MHRSLMSAAAAGALLIPSVATPTRGAPSALPSYARTLQLEPTADTSADVSIGDVNGDGKLDLVLIKGRHWPGMSRVLLGDGRGHFSGGHNLSNTRYRSYSGNLVDIDGNGTLDVILSNDTPDPKVVFTTASRIPFGPPDGTVRMALAADFDGDGLIDLALIDDEHKRVSFSARGNHGYSAA